MNTLKSQFVTYEIALKLKELEFDEPCFGYYTIMEDWMMKGKYSDNKLHFHGPNWANNDNTMRFMYVRNSFGDRDSTVKNSKFTKAIYNIAVPLWQQTVYWLREIHKINILIAPIYSSGNLKGYVFNFGLITMDNLSEVFKNGKFETFHKAQEQAILKALELINKE